MAAELRFASKVVLSRYFWATSWILLKQLFLSPSWPLRDRGIIVKYSPASEWIMCEFRLFPIFVENDPSKVDKILGLMFFKARKYSQGFKTATHIADSQTEQSSSLQRSDFTAWTNPFTFNFKPSRSFKTVLLRTTYFLSVSFYK